MTLKKIFLTVIALISMASASVFGMYGVDSDWITFLTDGNQFQARLETLGFVLGNDTIKGTFGFDMDGTRGLGAILTTTGTRGVVQYGDFIPNMSMGIGYTSSLIGVGVGYTVSIAERWRGVNDKLIQQAAHTPTLVLNALDNNLRIAIPIQVFSTKNLASISPTSNEAPNGTPASTTNSIDAVSIDAQFRYYTGLDILPQIRLYVRYGMVNFRERSASVDENGNPTTSTNKHKYESFGFDFRMFFGSLVEEVALQPEIRVKFDTATDRYLGSRGITAVDVARNVSDYNSALSAAAPNFDVKPYQVYVFAGLGLTANSDIVSAFLRPSLGLKVNEDGYNDTKVGFGLGWNIYAELSLTPIQNLEWYFELELGDIDYGAIPVTGGYAYAIQNSIGINASTGITWYLPEL